MRAVVLALIGIATAALLLWPWPPAEAPQPAPTEPGAAASDIATAHGEPAATQPGGDAPTSDAAARQHVATAPTDLPDDVWTVQLIGLAAGLPWTAPLTFHFENFAAIDGTVDDRGACRFVPPPIARLEGIQSMQVLANDVNYRLARSGQRTVPLQRTGRMELQVYPVAQLRGRVLGPDGHGVAARVQAFVFGPEGPREPVLARTESTADGSYTLRVPPATPLLLLAEATLAPPPALFARESSPDDGFDALDARQPRVDLLPATQRAEGLHGTPRAVPDLRLGGTQVLRGHAVLADGSPLVAAHVTATPQPLATAAWHGRLFWSAASGIVTGATTRTDPHGGFTLHLPPGASFSVQASTADPLLLAGEPSAIASAPGQVELRAPGDLVELRAEADGVAVQGAEFDLDTLAVPADRQGRRRVILGAQTVRVRARADVRTSAWVELPAGGRPAFVSLPLLTGDLAELRVLIHSDLVLYAARFALQPLPTGTPLDLTVQRQRRDEPFVLRVPVGRYRLLVRDAEGAQGGECMLPQPIDIDVPSSGLTITRDAAYGGVLFLDVLDGNGTRPAGTFTLRDAAGRDVTARTLVHGPDASGAPRAATLADVGELQPLGTNMLTTILAPGDYTLTVECEGHARAQQIVTIGRRTQVTARVRLRW